MRGLIDHGVANCHLTQQTLQTHNHTHTYKLYFGLGQTLTLAHTPDVFKVSLAGIRLGNHLVQRLNPKILSRSFLDMGTGSGVHALLMRKLGNDDIVATDVSERSIEQAKVNEKINFNNHKISFICSDLFKSVPERQFQTIIFNPPGWRTPSQTLTLQLDSIDQEATLPASAMFYGETVITRFLEDLPRYLEPTGVAIVGLNSMVGIRDVLDRYSQKYNNAPPLSHRLIERHTFPLIHYSSQWQALTAELQLEFKNWEAQDLAAFSTDSKGIIYWSYEVIEFFHCPTPQS